MSTSDLLNQMASTYARARTYADRGVVIRTFGSNEDRHRERLSFRTVFERPHRFRYELTDETTGQRLAIWQKTPPAQRYWTVSGQTESVDLAKAIAGATGISSGSALTVPQLLMPVLIDAWALSDLAGATRTGTESIEGVDCLRLAGQRQESPVSLWLGAQDLLVRRIRQKSHFGEAERDALLCGLPDDMQAMARELSTLPAFDIDVETVYFPELDRPVSPAEFEETAR
jgi:hypothetical protein